MFRTEAVPPAVPRGLQYVSDLKPGFTRKWRGKNFVYYDQRGRIIKDEAVLQRIKAIGVPPAYERVWISPRADGHIQATGYDARGRKQYRYHAQWRQTRDADKFAHILQFAQALPVIRRAVARDMALRGLPRDKVLATVVSLLEKTLIRVGNSEYARHNKSFGLTTITRRHVAVDGGAIRFRFTGKSGKAWDLAVHDRRIAAVVKRCADIPGQELFKYVDKDGAVRDVTSADVNDYLRRVSDEDFTAKDFRTWSGTVLAALALKEYLRYDSQAEAKKNIVRAIEQTAKQLGNTPTICRKCYIHPEIINAYLAGDLVRMIEGAIDAKVRTARHLSAEEMMVLAFLRQRLQKNSA